MINFKIIHHPNRKHIIITYFPHFEGENITILIHESMLKRQETKVRDYVLLIFVFQHLSTCICKIAHTLQPADRHSIYLELQGAMCQWPLSLWSLRFLELPLPLLDYRGHQFTHATPCCPHHIYLYYLLPGAWILFWDFNWIHSPKSCLSTPILLQFNRTYSSVTNSQDKYFWKVPLALFSESATLLYFRQPQSISLNSTDENKP